MPKKYTLAEEIGNGLYRVPVPRRVQILVPDWDRDQVRKNFKTLNFMNLQIIFPGLHSNFQRLLGITSELWTPIYFYTFLKSLSQLCKYHHKWDFIKNHEKKEEKRNERVLQCANEYQWKWVSKQAPIIRWTLTMSSVSKQRSEKRTRRGTKNRADDSDGGCCAANVLNAEPIFQLSWSSQ